MLRENGKNQRERLNHSGKLVMGSEFLSLPGDQLKAKLAAVEIGCVLQVT